MKNKIALRSVVCLALLSGLLLLAGCQQTDPTVNAAPKAAPGAKEPAPVQRDWKKVGPIGKGGGDV